jgi:hypothetical protein
MGWGNSALTFDSKLSPMEHPQNFGLKECPNDFLHLVDEETGSERGSDPPKGTQ